MLLEGGELWLRRAGAGHLLRSRGEAAVEIALPRPIRSREWLNEALVECECRHQVGERRSPVQRYCADCNAAIKRQRKPTVNGTSTKAVERLAIHRAAPDAKVGGFPVGLPGPCSHRSDCW
jgi:hypothetical protein